MQSLDNRRLWCWCDSMQSLCELTDDQWKSMQIPEGFVNAHCGSPLRADGVIGFKVQLDIYGATRSHRGRSDELDGENSHSHRTYARLTAQKLSTERNRKRQKKTGSRPLRWPMRLSGGSLIPSAEAHIQELPLTNQPTLTTFAVRRSAVGVGQRIAAVIIAKRPPVP